MKKRGRVGEAGLVDGFKFWLGHFAVTNLGEATQLFRASVSSSIL